MAKNGARPLAASAVAAGISGSAAQRPPAYGRVIADPVRGSNWITAQLRQAILNGGYAHGEKLPAERQLADAFSASRTTVRVALDRLEQERLVTRRVGSGTFVHFPKPTDSEDIAEMTSPLELIEVRLGIEPHMTRLAVLNATPRDVDRLGDLVERIDGADRDAETFTRLDEQFHLLIAECTRNPLMMWLYHRINEIRRHAQWIAIKDKVLTHERMSEYNRQHRALFEAIRSRDIEAAVAIITNHLHYARRQLLGADSLAG